MNMFFKILKGHAKKNNVLEKKEIIPLTDEEINHMKIKNIIMYAENCLQKMIKK